MSVSTLVAEFEGTDGQHLTVERSLRWPDKEFYLHATYLRGDYFAVEDAPAIALAILEAAGFVDTGCGRMSHIVRELRADAEEQEAAKREAEDRKALESEAEALFEAFREVDLCNLNHWGSLADVYKKPWLAAARAARELHKVVAK